MSVVVLSRVWVGLMVVVSTAMLGLAVVGMITFVQSAGGGDATLGLYPAVSVGFMASGTLLGGGGFVMLAHRDRYPVAVAVVSGLLPAFGLLFVGAGVLNGVEPLWSSNVLFLFGCLGWLGAGVGHAVAGRSRARDATGPAGSRLGEPAPPAAVPSRRQVAAQRAQQNIAEPGAHRSAQVRAASSWSASR